MDLNQGDNMLSEGEEEEEENSLSSENGFGDGYEEMEGDFFTTMNTMGSSHQISSSHTQQLQSDQLREIAQVDEKLAVHFLSMRMRETPFDESGQLYMDHQVKRQEEIEKQRKEKKLSKKSSKKGKKKGKKGKKGKKDKGGDGKKDKKKKNKEAAEDVEEKKMDEEPLNLPPLPYQNIEVKFLKFWLKIKK